MLEGGGGLKSYLDKIHLNSTYSNQGFPLVSYVFCCDAPVLHIKGGALVSQGVDAHSSVDVKLEKHKNVAQQAVEVKSSEKKRRRQVFLCITSFIFLVSISGKAQKRSTTSSGGEKAVEKKKRRRILGSK